MLPTDRPHWSSEDGLVALPKENFTLPSAAWEWEEEWYVEDNFKGQPLEPEVSVCFIISSLLIFHRKTNDIFILNMQYQNLI